MLINIKKTTDEKRECKVVVLVEVKAHGQLFHQNKCSSPAPGTKVLPDECRRSKPQI